MKPLASAWPLLFIAVPLYAEPGTAVDYSAADVAVSVAPERGLMIPKAKLGLTH